MKKFFDNIKNNIHDPTSFSFVMAFVLMCIVTFILGLYCYPTITVISLLIMCICRIVYAGVTGK